MARRSTVIPWWDACSEYWCARRARRDGTSQPHADRWQELGFLASRRISRPRKRSMTNFAASLKPPGAEVLHLPAASDLSLDAVYTHDPSLATDHGLIGLHPGKPNRIPEAQRHVEFCREPWHPDVGSNSPAGKN